MSVQVSFVVTDPSGAPLPGVVILEPTGALTGVTRKTDGGGFANFYSGDGFNPARHLDFVFLKAGYEFDATNENDHTTVTVGTDPLAPIVVTLQPSFKSAALPHLRVRGQNFEQENGARWTAIQCSDFNLLNRFQHGENIRPILAQRSAAGFNLLRVWTLYNAATIGVSFTDIDYARVPAFVRLCASYGLYVELTAYVQPELQDPSHWTRLSLAAVACTPRPLLEAMNEQDQHPIALPLWPAPGVLCSHGSNGSQAIPVQPFWDYATFHTNGAFEEQRKVGHNAMELSSGPVLTNETSRYPDVRGGLWTGDPERDKARAFDAAAGAALLCAGSCFHSVHGKTSELWDTNELAVAQAWTRGARSIPLSAQGQDYSHRQDLEGTGILRVYQRGAALAVIRA